MPEKFPTPHQETLSHYKQIGHREVLKEWRAIVPAGPKTLAKMESIFPELIQISKNFRKTGQRVEMHSVTFLDPVTGTIKDWRRLCGPHRIVSTPGDGWQEDYKLFLDAAVRSALAKRLEKKLVFCHN